MGHTRLNSYAQSESPKPQQGRLQGDLRKRLKPFRPSHAGWVILSGSPACSLPDGKEYYEEGDTHTYIVHGVVSKDYALKHTVQMDRQNEHAKTYR